jgi:hypothetical protein
MLEPDLIYCTITAWWVGGQDLPPLLLLLLLALLPCRGFLNNYLIQ